MIIGGGPETINLPRTQFIGKLCDEISWRSSKMATIPGLFVFYSEPANQKPRLVVSGPRKDANPSVNDKLHA